MKNYTWVPIIEVGIGINSTAHTIGKERGVFVKDANG